MDLHDKVALVTGGTMGIGAAIAIALAHRGAHVAINAREFGEEAQRTLDTIQTLGRKAIFLPGDLAQPEACEEVVNQTAQQLGRLDVLVHNAGGPAWGKVEELTPELWRHTFALHVDANFFLARAASPFLRQGKEAAYITVSSTAALRGVPGALAYSTAKGALLNFTRCLARDWAEDNIRVNAICPGIIRTRFHAAMTEERKKFNLDSRIPLRREGTPEQVAEAVLLLVTNDYITGESLVVDGGLTMRIA